MIDCFFAKKISIDWYFSTMARLRGAAQLILNILPVPPGFGVLRTSSGFV